MPLAAEMEPDALRALSALGGGSASGRDGPVVVTPVPLGAARLRERGFNQAEDLSRRLADRLGLEHAGLLVRQSGKGRQAGADRTLRRSNVAGRFAPAPDAVSPSGDAAQGAMRGVLLVDDVLTTGATLLECVRALEEAGFRRIAAITFARTLRASSSPPGSGSRFRRGTE